MKYAERAHVSEGWTVNVELQDSRRALNFGHFFTTLLGIQKG